MDIKRVVESLRTAIMELFGDNLIFLGLQGSYGRCEASDASDIDLVVILLECGKEELLKYKHLIDCQPEKDLLCGFVSSLAEIRAWESADRAQLLLDTIPIYRELAVLCPPVTFDDIKNAIMQGACAIHHAVSHAILHSKDLSIVPELYKNARFVIRIKYYFEKCEYISRFGILERLVDSDERLILDASNTATEEAAFRLLEWASRTILSMSGNTFSSESNT